MPLDPQAKALLDGMAATDAPPIEEQSPEEARLTGALLGQRSVPEEVVAVEDRAMSAVMVDAAGPALDDAASALREGLA